MTKDQKKLLIASVPVAIAIWWALKKRKEAAVINNQSAPNLPIGSNNPALDALNNDYKPPSIDINLNTNAANYLTNKYVPLFGYAGFAVA